jgi:hypothetical protein
VFAGWLKLRLDELTARLTRGPLPIIEKAWLPYPTNNISTGYAFAPWQLDFLGQSLGYCLQLGFTDAQTAFNVLAKFRMDSIDKCPHELSTLYSVAYCENHDRANGARATSWAECLQFQGGRVAAAAQCEEGSQALQDALGHTAPNNQPGDYDGYPSSDTGYAAMSQPMHAYNVDYGPDKVRALAVWHKFRDPRWYRIKWDDPKYNIVPRTAA